MPACSAKAEPTTRNRIARRFDDKASAISRMSAMPAAPIRNFVITPPEGMRRRAHAAARSSADHELQHGPPVKAESCPLMVARAGLFGAGAGLRHLFVTAGRRLD